LTPIDKIRAEVAELLRNHAENETRPYFCRAGHASPCAVYELAQDKLRLAEALEDSADPEHYSAWDRGHWSSTVDRVLEEVAR
jgi:hypothetical protein